MYRIPRNNWRAFLNTETPEGRLGIFLALLLVLLVVSAIRSIAQGGISENVALFVGRLLGFVLGITLHEWAHAYSAVRLGGLRALPDQTRLRLDPRVHLDPLGLLTSITVGFGWGRPVPVIPQAFYPRELRGMMLTAFAGPLANLVLAIAAAIIIRTLYVVGIVERLVIFSDGRVWVGATHDVIQFFFQILLTFLFFNVAVFFFNLIPLAPLDGWKVMLGLLPNEQAIQAQRYERESQFLLFALLAIGFLPGSVSPLTAIIQPLANLLFELLTGFDFIL